MRRLLAFSCALLLAGIFCLSQQEHVSAFWQSRDSNYNIAISGGGGGYTGPIDAAGSTPTAFWGLRAGAASYATGSNSAADIRCNATNFTGIVILSSGDFDIATAISDCGASSYAVFQGTVATTTLTVTSGPTHGTIAIGQHIFGVGIPDNTTISSGSGSTWTLSNSATVGVAEQINTSAITIQQLYDQVGSHPLTPWFTNQGSFLLPYYIGNLPGMFFISGGSFGLHNAAFASIAQPFTFYSVVTRMNGFTTTQAILHTNSDAANLTWNSTANQLFIGAPTFFGVTASDQNRHVVQGVFNGASSSVNVDNTLTTGTNPGANTVATNVGIGADSSSGALFLEGDIEETAIWPSALSTGNQTAVCHNSHTYWSTGTSC